MLIRALLATSAASGLLVVGARFLGIAKALFVAVCRTCCLIVESPQERPDRTDAADRHSSSHSFSRRPSRSSRNGCPNSYQDQNSR
jgi:hypothetical protein